MSLILGDISRNIIPSSLCWVLAALHSKDSSNMCVGTILNLTFFLLNTSLLEIIYVCTMEKHCTFIITIHFAKHTLCFRTVFHWSGGEILRLHKTCLDSEQGNPTIWSNSVEASIIHDQHKVKEIYCFCCTACQGSLIMMQHPHLITHSTVLFN